MLLLTSSLNVIISLLVTEQHTKNSVFQKSKKCSNCSHYCADIIISSLQSFDPTLNGSWECFVENIIAAIDVLWLNVCLTPKHSCAESFKIH